MPSTFNLPEPSLEGVRDSHQERLTVYDDRVRMIRNPALGTWDLVCRVPMGDSFILPVISKGPVWGWHTFTRDPLHGVSADRASWQFVKWLQTQRATDAHMDDAEFGEERKDDAEYKKVSAGLTDQWRGEVGKAKYRDAFYNDTARQMGI